MSGKILIATLALVLIIGCAVGGTAAWLSSKSDSVVTTFTYGDINITLTEAKPEKKPAKIIPGVDLEKDLTVTVKANSEDCWLFVKVEKSGTFVENKVTYSVDDGWTQGDGKAIPKNVYYRTVDTATTDTDFNILKGNCITVSDKLTKEDIKTALPALWECLQNGLRKTRQRLLIDPLHLSASLPGAADPAGAAELYGYVNAGMWTVMPQLERLMRIPDPRLHVEVDFDASELRLTGEVGVTLQIRDLLDIGLAFAKPVLRWYLAMQKWHSAQEKAQAKENGAAPKEHDTADRTPSGDGADHITT